MQRSFRSGVLISSSALLTSQLNRPAGPETGLAEGECLGDYPHVAVRPVLADQLQSVRIHGD